MVNHGELLLGVFGLRGEDEEEAVLVVPSGALRDALTLNGEVAGGAPADEGTAVVGTRGDALVVQEL